MRTEARGTEGHILRDRGHWRFLHKPVTSCISFGTIAGVGWEESLELRNHRVAAIIQVRNHRVAAIIQER